MARRKRASMREGPLADLFRATVEPDDPPEASAPAERRAEDETRVIREPAPEPAEVDPEPRSAHEDQGAAPVAPYGVGEEVDDPPAARERLHRIFSEDAVDVDGPIYGRDEPSYGHGMASSEEPRPHAPVIRVVGVGGAGVNAINRMVEAGIPGVEFMAVNTDLQSLQQSTADVTVHLGSGMARGLGAGSEPAARLPGGVRGAGQDQAPAQGLGHGLRHRRRRRRHRAPARHR